MPLPYLTPDLPGIGGVIKERPEDFFVQEIALYEPTGEGEHTYCEIQKINTTTFAAIDRIAEALNVSTRDIGYAGLKDAHAITRQTLSIWGTTPEAVMALKLPDIQILWAQRHVNKLRLGHLAGNRFAIRVRDVDAAVVIKAQPIVARLEQAGMPNYFGEQRFGRRNDNDILGACLIRGRPDELLSRLLGTPEKGVDDDASFQARTLFDQGRYEEAMHQMHRRNGMERRVLARFMKTKKAGEAVRAIDDKLRRLWVSATQSRIFNDVVAVRIASLGTVQIGDFAYKHENGACFLVEDAATEQPRADAFEISPSGPLVGSRMSHPAGEVEAIEAAVLKAHGLTFGHFKQEGRDIPPGARRPLRVKPTDVQLTAGGDQFGPHVTVAFTLPSGSYATVLMREVMKDEVDDEVDPSAENVTAA